MKKSLKFFFELSRVHAVMSRRFDCKLGGLGYNELMILSYLSQDPENKMRRSDLAEKVGLTPSGITRLLLPMEKVGYIKRETNEHDGRVSYVALASGGKRRLSEGMERAEIFMEEIIPPAKEKKLEEISRTIKELGLA